MCYLENNLLSKKILIKSVLALAHFFYNLNTMVYTKDIKEVQKIK